LLLLSNGQRQSCHASLWRLLQLHGLGQARVLAVRIVCILLC